MKRNGKIELMRFVFCVIILLFHGCQDAGKLDTSIFSIGSLHFSFFSHGRLGVEFFFLVTGFLLAKSIYRLENEKPGCTARNIGTETTLSIWKRLKMVLPYGLFYGCLAIALYSVTFSGEKLALKLFDGSGGLMFLQRTGLVPTNSYLGVSWYISSMLIAILIIYPICRRWYNMFTHVIAPVIGMVCIGYIIFTQGTFIGTTKWVEFTFVCNIRAIGEIALGTICFEFCRFMSQKNFSIVARVLLTIAEILCYCLVIGFICTLLPQKYCGIIILLMMVAITISFSQKTLLGETKPFQNRFFGFLGAISLPVFLCQRIFRDINKYYMTGHPAYEKILMVLIPSIILGTLSYIAWSLIQKAWKNRKQTGKRAAA